MGYPPTGTGEGSMGVGHTGVKVTGGALLARDGGCGSATGNLAGAPLSGGDGQNQSALSTRGGRLTRRRFAKVGANWVMDGCPLSRPGATPGAMRR